ncbi:hypothetical protein LSH36_635g01022 [Paralvinella palmiformis]|uniref:FAD-binding domain-containing protein n=1 Tax=Paralvinella palmiformis TaxID=53620 RepID=A0AAD9MW53_9ANNE|nr:hypothetical protein LSH36_635g01022 [Paralvinella palmiformis]
MATQFIRRLSLCGKGARIPVSICRSFHNSRALSTDGHYDVIISGGGMVGSAMAAALAHEPVLADRNVLLLEAGSPKPMDKPPAVLQSRVCALSPGTVELLSSFGAWENISDMRYKEVKGMQVWESCSDGIITFSQDQLTDNLAYIVENDVILAAVMQQLEKVKDRVEVKHNAVVKKYFLSDAGHSTGDDDKRHLARVVLDDGTILTTDLLIGADGQKSLLREMAGFHTINWDYNQFAVVATLKLVDHSDNSVAWQRFLPTGPIAMLPWTDEHKNPLADYVSDVFDNVLTTFGFSGSTSQQLPPTVIGIEENTIGNDAAHRVHPLAGQGVNLGFGDVTSLCDHITKALSAGQDIGDLNHLLDYETERQRQVLPMMAAVDGLNRLYSTKFTPIVLLRTVGLQATNALTPLKEKIISQAAR